MRLMEIMTTDVETVPPDLDAEQAWQRMRALRIHHLVVADRRRVVGVLSEADLGGPKGAAVRRGRTAAELMSEQTVTATPTTTVQKAANLLRAQSVGALPVLEDGKLVGIVTITDLLELLGRGGQPTPTNAGRYQPNHPSKWKPVRRIARKERPALFPR